MDNCSHVSSGRRRTAGDIYERLSEGTQVDSFCESLVVTKRMSAPSFVGNSLPRGKFEVLYSVNEACKQLSIGRTLVYKLIKSGELEAVKIRGRTLITIASITKLIETMRTA